MTSNVASQLGRLTADQLATVTFEAGFDASLTFSSASYAGFVASNYNVNNPGSPAIQPEVDTIQNGLQAGGTVTIGFYNQVPADAFSVAEENKALQALAIWSGIADITFRVVPAAQANFVFVHSGDTIGSDTAAVPAGTFFSARQTTATGTANLFRTDTGYIALDNTTTVSGSSNLAYGDFTSLTVQAGYGFDVLVHEVGHLVGLGHTGPYNFSTTPALNVPPDPNQNNQSDVRTWSVMSYVDPTDSTAFASSYSPVVGWGSDPVSGSNRVPLTPMGLDIVAAQRLLGASGSPAFGGHDIFGFNSNITFTDIGGNQAKIEAYDFSLDPLPIITIYDYGQDNTLDLSGFAIASTLDLRDGNWSSVAGLTNNIFIEWGTTIDTAVGGSGDDTITANGDGNTIDGGGGADVVILPDRRADYAYAQSGATIVLTDTRPGHLGTNRLTSVNSVQFSDTTVASGALSFIRWTGAADHDFGNAANWSPAQVPSGQSDVLIDGPAGTSVQVVQQSTNSMDSLFIAAGNSLDITIGQFGFSGANSSSVIAGTLAVDSGAIAYFSGNLVNSGIVQLAGNFLADGPSIAVGGGGTFELQNGVIAAFEDANGAPLQYDAFTNSDNTIEGFGVIGSSGLTFPIRFQNAGLVLANEPLPLVVKGATTNTGTLAQAGIGTLDLQGEVVNTAGLVVADGGLGEVLLDGVLLHGGRLFATNGGVLAGTGAVTLDSSAGAVTLDTHLVLDAGSGLTLLGRIGGSGTIDAAGAGLFLSGPHVLGVPVTGNPTIHYIGNGPTIFGVSPIGTVDAGLTVDAGKSLTFAETPQGHDFVLDNALTLAGTGALGATLFVDSFAGFQGGGTIAMTGTGDALAGVERLGGPDWLFLQDVTVTGVGDLGANSLAISIEQGSSIVAAGGTMFLDAADHGGQSNGGRATNLGWVGAASGATLVVMGTLDNQQGGTLGATGTIAVGGGIDGTSRAGAIVAGTLPAGGRMEGSAAGGTLFGITNQGLITVGPDQTLRLAQTIHNAATISVTGSFDAGGTADHLARLLVTSHVSLASGGMVVLGNGDAALTGSGTLENIDNTISGQGTLGGGGLQFINEFDGTVDGTLGGLVVDGTSGGQFNYGTFEATAGGTLVLTGSIVNGSDIFASPVFIGGGGTVAASGAGSVVRLDGAALRNGVVTSDGGGVVLVTGSSTLASDSQFVPGFDNAASAAETLAAMQVAAGATLTAVNGLGNAGTIALGDGAVLLASGSGGELAGHGTVTLAGSARLAAAAPGDSLQNDDNLIIGVGQIGGGAAGISNQGGTIIAAGGTLALDLGAGNGFVNQGGTLGSAGGVLSVAGGLTNNGWIDAAGGAVVIGGALTGSGNITLEAGGTVALGGAVAFGQNFTFAGSGATLDIGVPASMSGSLAGLAAGDTIRFEGVAGDDTFFTGSSLQLRNDGTTVASVSMFGNYFSSIFDVTGDGAGGSLVTLACFAGGTRIATMAGEVPVEALRIGDRVLSAFGGSVPVVWIGHRRVDCARHPRPRDVWPVRVRAGAFGPGRPRHDLLLSPDHAVHVGGDAEVGAPGDAEAGAPGDAEAGAPGVLIPVRYLVNGASIVQEKVAAVTYWHVELPAHDVVLAEGLACESYLDTGNRAAFANGGAVVQAHADFARSVWEAEGCATLVLAGARLAAARARLLRQAAILGHRLTDDPALEVTADRPGAAVRRRGAVVRVALPAGARRLRIGSRGWVPDQTRPEETDTRRLGVAVTDIRLDGRALALASPRLAAGWHEAEAEWRWTDGEGLIDVDGVRTLRFRVALSGSYWASAPDGEAARRA